MFDPLIGSVSVSCGVLERFVVMDNSILEAGFFIQMGFEEKITFYPKTHHELSKRQQIFVSNAIGVFRQK